MVESSVRDPVICQLSLQSLDALMQIEIESNRPVWSRRVMTREFSNQYARIFGARAEGRLAGFIVSHVVLDEVKPWSPLDYPRRSRP